VSGILYGGIVCAAIVLPTAAIVLVVVLGAAEVALFVWALVDLIRRKHTTLLPRWAWLVLMIIFELFGPILYLALGRGQPPAADTTPTGGAIGGAELDESRSQRAVDLLYGPGGSTPPQAPDRAGGEPHGRPSQWAPTSGDEPASDSRPAGGDGPLGPGLGGA
jgi:hypothetical protein